MCAAIKKFPKNLPRILPKILPNSLMILASTFFAHSSYGAKEISSKELLNCNELIVTEDLKIKHDHNVDDLLSVNETYHPRHQQIVDKLNPERMNIICKKITFKNNSTILVDTDTDFYIGKLSGKASFDGTGKSFDHQVPLVPEIFSKPGDQPHRSGRAGSGRDASCGVKIKCNLVCYPKPWSRKSTRGGNGEHGIHGTNGYVRGQLQSMGKLKLSRAEDGMQGASMKFEIDSVGWMTKLLVASDGGNGKNGAKGIDGQNGGNGGNGQRSGNGGKPNKECGLNGAKAGTGGNGGRAGNGGDAGHGQDGGHGGNGGKIHVITYFNYKKLPMTLYAAGGNPGIGGAPGLPGNPGQPGRRGGSGRNHYGSQYPGQDGTNGTKGKPGNKGNNGTKGKPGECKRPLVIQPVSNDFNFNDFDFNDDASFESVAKTKSFECDQK